MTNSSLLVSGAAPVAAAAAVVAATPLWELLSGHHYPLLPGSGLSNGSSSSHSNNTSSGSSGGAYSNSTPRAYRTATFRDGGGGGGDPGGEEAVGDDLGSCHDWQAAQHTLFQLANLCVAVSFLTTASFRFHLLFLRCILLLAFLLFLLWAGLFICMPDVLGWNLVFFLLNGAHIAWLVYRHLPSRLPLSHCALYAKVFKPVRVSQEEFLELCQLGTLQTLSKGGLYAIEGLTPCGERVSVLIKGRLKVTYQRLFLHHIEASQFVDAAEYDSLTLQLAACDKYQVTIAATEESVLLTWDYPTLQGYLSTHPFIKTMLHYLTGKDVCSHLYAIQEQLMQAPDYMSTLASRHSSMVNVRSCLAAHESSSSLSHMTGLTGYRQPSEPESSSTTQPTSPNTVETSV